MTLFCIAVGTATAWCGGRCAMPDGHCLLFSAVTAPGPRQPWSSRLAPVLRFHSSVPLFPSLILEIGLLTSVDVKQQSLSHPLSWSEPVWPSGKQKGLHLIPLRPSLLFKKVVVCGCRLVTLSLTFNGSLKWLSLLPILMQKSFWW